MPQVKVHYLGYDLCFRRVGLYRHVEEQGLAKGQGTCQMGLLAMMGKPRGQAKSNRVPGGP